jgi:hypothetical protein
MRSASYSMERRTHEARKEDNIENMESHRSRYEKLGHIQKCMTKTKWRQPPPSKGMNRPPGLGSFKSSNRMVRRAPDGIDFNLTLTFFNSPVPSMWNLQNLSLHFRLLHQQVLALMLYLLVDVTLHYDHEQTPFATPHFGTFMRGLLLLSDFRISECFRTRYMVHVPPVINDYDGLREFKLRESSLLLNLFLLVTNQ